MFFAHFALTTYVKHVTARCRPIFQVNFITAINDAYWLTFWLSVATLVLTLTLPGRPKSEKGASAGEEAPSSTPVEESA